MMMSGTASSRRSREAFFYDGEAIRVDLRLSQSPTVGSSAQADNMQFAQFDSTFYSLSNQGYILCLLYSSLKHIMQQN